MNDSSPGLHSTEDAFDIIGKEVAELIIRRASELIPEAEGRKLCANCFGAALWNALIHQAVDDDWSAEQMIHVFTSLENAAATARARASLEAGGFIGELREAGVEGELTMIDANNLPDDLPADAREVIERMIQVAHETGGTVASIAMGKSPGTKH